MLVLCFLKGIRGTSRPKEFIMSSSEIENYALKKLAHYVSGQEDGVGKTALSFLCAQALLEVGNQKSPKKVAWGIVQTFKLNFPPHEVKIALDILVLEKNAVLLNDKYSLTPQYSEELEKANKTFKDSEEKIYADWFDLMAAKYALPENSRSAFVGALQLYLNQIFLKHGAECTVFVYPDGDRINALVAKHSENILEKITQPLLKPQKDICRTELPNFFSDLNTEKRK